MKRLAMVGRAIKYSDMASGLKLEDAAQWQYPAAMLVHRPPRGSTVVRTLPDDLWDAAIVVRLAAEEAGA